MMHIATLHAYDAISTVTTHAVVRAFPDDPEAPSHIVFECTTTVPGTGETDPRLWLQDALVAMLERL